jgi:hypothetical protein
MFVIGRSKQLACEVCLRICDWFGANAQDGLIVGHIRAAGQQA